MQGFWAHGPLLQELGKRKSSRREKTGIWRRRYQGKFAIFGQFKRGRESRVPQLGSYNKYNVLATEINVDVLKSEGSKKMEEERTLREVMVKIGLERIDM